MIASNENQQMRLKKSNPKRDEFTSLVENVRLSSSFNNRFCIFNEILENLRTKCVTIYDTDAFSTVFEFLLKGAETKRTSETWTEMEINFLASLVAYYCLYSSEDFRALSDKDWQYIEAVFPTKQICQIIKQWNCLLKVNVRNCPWTAEEDKALTMLVAECGAHRNWRIISEKLNDLNGMSVARDMRQCKDRWVKHLDSKINKGDWSKEEDLKLVKAFLTYGKKWAELAKILGSRTDVAVKNRLNSILKTEDKSAISLDENLSKSDVDSDKRIARRVLEKISVECQKKPIRVQKESAKQIGTSENDIQMQSFLAGNKQMSFKVINGATSPKSDEARARASSSPQIFFALIDMRNQEMRFIDQAMAWNAI